MKHLATATLEQKSVLKDLLTITRNGIFVKYNVFSFMINFQLRYLTFGLYPFTEQISIRYHSQQLSNIVYQQI